MNLNINDFELGANFIVIIATLFSIIYAFGIVWRVEKNWMFPINCCFLPLFFSLFLKY